MLLSCARRDLRTRRFLLCAERHKHACMHACHLFKKRRFLRVYNTSLLVYPRYQTLGIRSSVSDPRYQTLGIRPSVLGPRYQTLGIRPSVSERRKLRQWAAVLSSNVCHRRRSSTEVVVNVHGINSVFLRHSSFLRPKTTQVVICLRQAWSSFFLSLDQGGFAG